MKPPRFLSVENVIELHKRTMEVEGGASGIRDYGLLESAVTAPRQTFGGEYLHPDLSSMAGAYLYHLVKNHPFVDGNKRAGALSFLFFMKKNDPERVPGPEKLERVVMAVAAGSMSKEALIEWVRGLKRPGGAGKQRVADSLAKIRKQPGYGEMLSNLADDS